MGNKLQPLNYNIWFPQHFRTHSNNSSASIKNQRRIYGDFLYVVCNFKAILSIFTEILRN